MVSRPDWNVNGKENGSVSGLMSAGPRGRDGVPERPSCKYRTVAHVEIGVWFPSLVPVCRYVD